MADYYQLKNQNIFNPPANTDMGNANSQFNTMYVQNALVLGNVSVTGTTIIAPRVSSIAYPGNDTAADTAGGQTITLTGSGFVAGASVLINGSAVGVVSVVSSTSITFTSPANSTGSYVIYVVNSDGSTAIAIPGIQYSGTPNWTTAAGSLGNVYETASFNQTVTATGDAPITYSVVSGSLPPGSTFNANGTVTGTSQLSASPTTYSFTVRATDAEQQDTNRAFSIAVIPDVVTWSNPTNNTSYSPAANVAMANITLSATSAVGSGITYSANTLPTGLSLTGANISGTPTVIDNTSSLLTATANTTTESSSITINWSVSVASDPYFMYNSLLLPGTGTNNAQNNTLIDSSTNNFTVTRTGAPTQGTFSPFSQTGWSGYFNGSTDNLSVPAGAFVFSTNSFTVEAWVNTSAYNISGNGGEMLIDNWAGAPSGSWVTNQWQIWINTAGVLKFEYATGASTTVSIGTDTVSLNTWTHIAVVRNSTTVTVYVNGVASGSGTVSQSLGVSAVGSIARQTIGNAYRYIGYISNARVVIGTAVYTTAFTPPIAPLTAISGTSLLTLQDNCFKDNSTNNFAITTAGTPSIQAFSPFDPAAAYSADAVGGSMYFNGSPDILTTSSTALNTSDFTLEFWIYTDNYINATTYAGIFDSRVSGPDSTGWSLYFRSTSAVLVLRLGSSDITFSYTYVILNSWNHIAVTRSGSVFTVYINGVSRVTSTNTISLGRTTYKVGSTFDSYYFRGYISDFRIVNGTVVYTTAFTPPTAPLTAIANTSLLLLGTNAGIVDATAKNLITTVGDAKISTTQSEFGGSSMYFDGNTGYIIVRPNQAFNFGTGNFTIECWVYRIAASSQNILLTNRPSVSATANGDFWIDNNTSSISRTCFLSQGGTLYNIAGPSDYPAAGNWFHYAVVRNGTSLAAYINGASAGSATVSTSDAFGSSTAGIYAGRFTDSNAWFLNGYIDDLRITKGYARYTSNFTPPTSAFPTY